MCTHLWQWLIRAAFHTYKLHTFTVNCHVKWRHATFLSYLFSFFAAIASRHAFIAIGRRVFAVKVRTEIPRLLFRPYDSFDARHGTSPVSKLINGFIIDSFHRQTRLEKHSSQLRTHCLGGRCGVSAFFKPRRFSNVEATQPPIRPESLNP